MGSPDNAGVVTMPLMSKRKPPPPPPPPGGPETPSQGPPAPEQRRVVVNLPADLAARLEAYIASRQPFPPSMGAVIRAALDLFLTPHSGP